MVQATLDDDELFGEAAEELAEDVTSHLDEAQEALPDPEQVWQAEADNVLGVLNTLRSTLDVDEANRHLREAKKWYAVAERADVFSDETELAQRIETIESTIVSLDSVRSEVGSVASTLPGLREALQDTGDTEAATGD